MVPQAFDVLFGFNGHIRDELVVSRVYTTRKLEVLPDQDAKFFFPSELFSLVVRLADLPSQIS